MLESLPSDGGEFDKWYKPIRKEFKSSVLMKLFEQLLAEIRKRDAAGVDSIDDGAVGETAVNPPHAVASSDSATATSLGSFMDAQHCRFRSGGNPPLQRPGWQVMTS